MGLADDLLEVAERLANPTPADPEQASLRRGVSTAYYALFQLLVDEVGQLWKGGDATSRQRVERALEHAAMKEVSQVFTQITWKNWSGQTVELPTQLRDVAETFGWLQQKRHEADYNSSLFWTPKEAQEIVQQVRLAFQQWRAVRTQTIAQDYLLSLLVGKKRR